MAEDFSIISGVATLLNLAAEGQRAQQARATLKKNKKSDDGGKDSDDSAAEGGTRRGVRVLPARSENSRTAAGFIDVQSIRFDQQRELQRRSILHSRAHKANKDKRGVGAKKPAAKASKPMFSLGQLARLIPTLKPAQLARFRVMSDLWDRDSMREQFFEEDGRAKTGLLPDALMGSGPPGRKITTYEELLNLFVSVERAKTDGVSISNPTARNPEAIKTPKPQRPSRLPRKPQDAIDTRDPTDSVLDPLHPIGFSKAAGRRFSTIGV